MWDEKGRIGASLKAGSIRGECEGSLRRLKIDVIDLYQIHWPEPDEDIEGPADGRHDESASRSIRVRRLAQESV